jgi:anti-sigma factor RsiW
MKCEDISKELISCFDRKASSEVRSEVESHLATCAGCRTRAAEFSQLWSVLDEVPAVEPSFGFDARIRQRVAAEPQPQWFQWIVPQARRFAFSTALLVALAVWLAKLPPNHSVTAPTVAAAQQEDFNAIKDLGVLENYDVVTKMDALSELAPTAAQQPDRPQQDQQPGHNNGGA